MSDAIEKVAELVGGADAYGEQDEEVYTHIAEDILATLTPGTRWVAADGREMVVVPAEASEAMMAASYRIPHARDEEIYAAMIAAASEPDAPSQASDAREGE